MMRLFRRRKVGVTEGSGNIFADLGLPDADELQAKSGGAIAARRAVRRLGIDPNLLSWALHGELGRATAAEFRALAAQIDELQGGGYVVTETYPPLVDGDGNAAPWPAGQPGVISMERIERGE